ncbi:MAG: hypothetical protein ACPGQD_04045 [Planctomycetota bacterium]
MRWVYPVYRVERAKDLEKGATVSVGSQGALPKDRAFYTIASDDRRPLLVLRECKLCNGTDDALLSRSGANDKTLIMTRWFRCVKLPMYVLEEDHPFHTLFEEENPPHLFLARWDGSNPIPLRGDLSRTELWDNMYTMLAQEYKKDASKAVKEIERIIAQYDVYDEKIARLEIAIDDEIERAGPKSRKLKKKRKDLDKAKADLAELKADEAKASELVLLRPDEQPPAGAMEPSEGPKVPPPPVGTR